MELWENYCNDNNFGKKLRKQVEYMLSGYTRRPDKEDVVLVNFLNGTLEISGFRHDFRKGCAAQ